jgi:hypothetical protein
MYDPEDQNQLEATQRPRTIHDILRELGDRKKYPRGNGIFVNITHELVGPISMVGVGSHGADFADRIHPGRLGFSPKLVAVVGAVIGHDYGVVDGNGGTPTSISITSDGCVIAGSTAHEAGVFIGSATEMEANLQLWKNHLTPADRGHFEKLYAVNVVDWRGR